MTIKYLTCLLQDFFFPKKCYICGTLGPLLCHLCMDLVKITSGSSRCRVCSAFLNKGKTFCSHCSDKSEFFFYVLFENVQAARLNRLLYLGKFGVIEYVVSCIDQFLIMKERQVSYVVSIGFKGINPILVSELGKKLNIPYKIFWGNIFLLKSFLKRQKDHKVIICLLAYALKDKQKKRLQLLEHEIQCTVIFLSIFNSY